MLPVLRKVRQLRQLQGAAQERVPLGVRQLAALEAAQDRQVVLGPFRSLYQPHHQRPQAVRGEVQEPAQNRYQVL